MSSDELTALFDEATETGLGDRDATVRIDYETDCVVLELACGSGEIAVETTGTPAEGSDSLWSALTGTCGVACEYDTAPLADARDEVSEEDLLLA